MIQLGLPVLYISAESSSILEDNVVSTSSTPSATVTISYQDGSDSTVCIYTLNVIEDSDSTSNLLPIKT